jgi:hypothetical protein
MRPAIHTYESLRELAHRANDGIEVTLLWDKRDDTLSVWRLTAARVSWSSSTLTVTKRWTRSIIRTPTRCRRRERGIETVMRAGCSANV